jgi:hypothetical protein
MRGILLLVLVIHGVLLTAGFHTGGRVLSWAHKTPCRSVSKRDPSQDFTLFSNAQNENSIRESGKNTMIGSFSIDARLLLNGVAILWGTQVSLIKKDLPYIFSKKSYVFPLFIPTHSMWSSSQLLTSTPLPHF